MIPQRIFLKGFLSYREEQEVMLDGSSLWMMAGLNGSGKSSVFDAITYALFGHHRGGSLQAHELINHECDRATVELDFLLDGQAYQARRTLSRKASGGATATQQLYLITPEGKKEAVEGTQRKTDFAKWVKQHVGLTYETFTSSVLLLQGKAEKLLDSTAAGRFDVLAGIVDLQRYRRLHERADTKRKELKAAVEALQHQLEGLPEVGELQIEEAEGKIRGCTTDLEAMQTEVEKRQAIAQQVAKCREVLAKMAKLEQQWQASEALLKEAEEIEKDLVRLEELEQVLPPLQRIMEKRNLIRKLRKDDEQLAQEELAVADGIQKKEEKIKQVRNTIDRIRKMLTEAEEEHQKSGSRLQELASIMSKVTLCEQQREALKKQEEDIAAFKDDPTGEVQSLKQQIAELEERARALPVLTRFQQRRSSLLCAVEMEKKSREAEKQIKAEGVELREQHDRLTKEVELSSRNRQEAEKKAAVAKTLLDQANEQVRAFTELEGARVCRQCGQPLTQSHYEEEKGKREKELADAIRIEEEARSASEMASSHEAKLKEKWSKDDEELEQARYHYNEATNALKQAQADTIRYVAECQEVHQEIPEPFLSLIGMEDSGSDQPELWLSTTYPEEKDLQNLKKEAATLTRLQNEVQKAEEKRQKWQSLKAQCDAIRKNLETLEAELPGQVDELRREHIRVKADESTLKAQVQGYRTEEREAQKELEKLSEERASLGQRLSNLQSTRTSKANESKVYEETIQGTMAALSEQWHPIAEQVDMGAIHRWGSELDLLKRNNTRARAEQLKQARVELGSIKAQKDQLEKDLQELPEEAKQSPEEAEQSLSEAKKRREEAQKQLQEAQHNKALLESQQKQRSQIEQRLLEKQREHNRYHILSQLLSRDRLQRHLVRRAERQVVDHANAVLDRLSGGQLYLRLRGSEEASSDKALELEAYNRTTTQAPINVSFLSGSQRFRVAVSLALGLGQYASKQHRPIESVIIDEGFGCLDRQGRQVMIQELQNLRGQLRCILLVSHQEEFADAFADGYHFELEEGATRVKRFQR